MFVGVGVALGCGGRGVPARVACGGGDGGGCGVAFGGGDEGVGARVLEVVVFAMDEARW